MKDIITRFISTILLICFCLLPAQLNVLADDDDSEKTPECPQWLLVYSSAESIEKIVSWNKYINESGETLGYLIVGADANGHAVMLKVVTDTVISVGDELNPKYSMSFQTLKASLDEPLTQGMVDNGFSYFHNIEHTSESGTGIVTRDVNTDEFSIITKTHSHTINSEVEDSKNFTQAIVSSGSSTPTLRPVYKYDANNVDIEKSINFRVNAAYIGDDGKQHAKIGNYSADYKFYNFSSNEPPWWDFLTRLEIEDSENHKSLIGSTVTYHYEHDLVHPQKTIVQSKSGTEVYERKLTKGNPYARFPNSDSYVIVRTKSIDNKNTYEGYYDEMTNNLYKVKWTQKNDKNSSSTVVLHYDTTTHGLSRVTAEKYEGGKWIEEDITKQFFEDQKAKKAGERLYEGANWDPFDGWNTSKTIRGGGGGAPWKQLLSYPASLNISPIHLFSNSILREALMRGDISPAEYAKFNGANGVEAAIFELQYKLRQHISKIKNAVSNTINKFDYNRNNFDFVRGKIYGKWQLTHIDMIQ